MGYLGANFGIPRPLCSRLRPDVRDRQTDVRQHHRFMPTLEAGHNNRISIAPRSYLQRRWRQVESVFSKSLIEQKRFKSGFKNRQRIANENFVAASSRQSVLKTGSTPEKSVIMNGWISSGMADERKVRLQARSAIGIQIWWKYYPLRV